MDRALPAATTTVTAAASGTYVCHGITWATGDPRLLLTPLPSGALIFTEIMGRRLGYQVTGTSTWCTGRYRFVDRVHVEAVACPERNQAEAGGQCRPCAGRDEFRFASVPLRRPRS